MTNEFHFEDHELDEISPKLSEEQNNKINKFYLDDNELLERHKKAIPPKEAYLYFPTEEDQIVYNAKSPEDSLRFIFLGVQYNEFELNKIKEFHEKINHKNQKHKNKIILPKWWRECDTLRYLQASNFKVDKALEMITEQIKWIYSYFPFTINDNVIKILNSDFIKVFGRDNHYRPIFVIKLRVFFQIKELYTYEEIEMSIIYFLEYIINNLLIDGQVENWNLITDMKEVSIVFMPSDLKKIMGVLTNNYRGRLYRNFITGMNSGLRFLANFFIGLVGKNSAMKVRFLSKENRVQELTTCINEQNLEEQYGGKVRSIEPDNKGNIFPPVMPSDNFSKEGDNFLISEEEYKAKCQNPETKPIIICQEFIDKWQKEEELARQKELEEQRKKEEEEMLRIQKEKEEEMMRIQKEKEEEIIRIQRELENQNKKTSYNCNKQIILDFQETIKDLCFENEGYSKSKFYKIATNKSNIINKNHPIKVCVSNLLQIDFNSMKTGIDITQNQN